MFNSIRNTFIGISLSVAATSAAAIPITFDFSDSGNRFLGSSHTFSESGLAVNTTAIGKRRSKLAQTSSGLGVGRTNWWDSNQLDGLGPDESISFNFSSSVRLLGFTLSSVRFKDQASLTVDNFPTLTYNLLGNKYFNSTVKVKTDFVGTDFLFGVTDFNDSYFIKSLIVETADVPEPGTLALFAVGLVGLGLARKRAKQ